MKLPLFDGPIGSGSGNFLKWTLFLTVVFAAGISGASCSDDNDPSATADSPRVLEFNSAVTGYGKTRVVETQWGEDNIGVFMFENGQPASAATDLGYNKNYYTEGDGNFSPLTAADRLKLSEDDGAVDILAYYPYTNNLDGYIFNVDITDQMIQEDLDFLYSEKIEGITASSAIKTLSFNRQMSKIVFNITNTGPGGASALRNLEAKVTGARTKGKFDLLTGTLTQDDTSVDEFDMWLLTTTEGRTAEAILMPTQDVSDIKFIFTVGEEQFTLDFPAGKVLQRGHKLIYAVRLNSEEPAVVEPVNGWMELPAAEEIPYTQQVTHMMSGGRNYTLLYDTKYMISYWVAYPLVTDHIGNVSRTNAWAFDPSVPSEYQANLKLGSYNDSSYDRGHQLPSGDRTHDRTANQQTFYSTNMTPQNSTLNQNAWAKLEAEVRKWAQKCDTMYVVTGAILPENEDQITYIPDKAGKNIAKPEYYFKALARRTGETFSTVAYKYDNVSTTGSNFDNYKLSVKELEDLTGFEFFPALSDAIKSNTDVTSWY
ncbi:MAG: DNA/RNA non-specific endonuclease [Rikenellaceae bacterium]|nr:DNA/RNA non-specific endonuclease [Rikenellaceae bacterium]